MNNDRFDPKGVIPACLMPFDTRLEVDEAAYRRHLSDLAGVEGITAITVNGHAAEVHALSFEEQQRGIEIAHDEVGGELPLVNGIHTGNIREASRLATMATEAGADALLVPAKGPRRGHFDCLRVPRIRCGRFRRLGNAFRRFCGASGRGFREEY